MADVRRRVAIVLDAEGQAFIGEFDQATGSVRKLEGATEKLERAQKSGGREASRYERNMASLRKGAAAAAAALGGMATIAAGAVVAGFGVAIAKTVEWGDQLDKLNLRIGASTEGLSEYAYVAERSGVQFNALTTGWQRQTRRIAEAAQGTGEARKALDELGLSAKQLNELAPEDQFEVIAQSLQGVANEQDRVRLAMKFWDSEGVALLQIVNQGSEAMAEMRQEARELGLTMDRETAAQMAAVSDELTRTKAAFNGVAQAVAIDLAPVLTDFLSFMSSSLIPGFRSLLEVLGLIDEQIRGMKLPELENLRSEAEREVQAIQNLIAAATAPQSDAARIASGAIVTTTTNVSALRLQLAEAQGRLKEINDEIGRLKAPLDSAAKGSALFADGMEGVGDSAGDAADEVAKYIEALEGELETMGLTEEQLIRLEAERQKALTTNEGQRQKIDELVAAYLREIAAADAADAATKRVEAGKKAAAEAQDRLTQMYREALGQVNPLAAATQEFAEKVFFLFQQFALGQLSGEEFTEMLALLKAQYEQTVRGMREGNEAAKEGIDDLRGEANPFAVAWERAIQRLDDAGVQFWEDFLRTGEISMESVKDIFIRMLAEMAHAALTRNILINVGVTSGGGASFTGASGGGGLGGSGSGSLIGAGVIPAIGGVLGAEYGTAGSVAGGAIGGYLATTTTLGTAFGTGLIGSGVAAAGTAVSGTALGAELGTAVMPIIGTIVGAIIGWLSGRIFNNNTNPSSQLSFGQARGPQDVQLTQDFGAVFLGSGRDGFHEYKEEIARPFQEFFSYLSTVVNDAQRDAITAALAGMGDIQITREMLADGSFFEDSGVFDAVLGALDPAIQDFVSGVGDNLEDKIRALNIGIQLEQLVPLTGLFDTLDEALAAFEGVVDTDADIRQIVGTMELLTAAFELLGMSTDMLSADLVAMSADFLEAAGGLDRATALWTGFLGDFFTPEEQAELAASQARTAAAGAFDEIGLSLDDFTGSDGMQRFRELFESVFPTLTGEAQVAWLEAAAALGLLTEKERELLAVRGEAVDAAPIDLPADPERVVGATPGADPFTFGDSVFVPREADRADAQADLAEPLAAYADYIAGIREETAALLSDPSPAGRIAEIYEAERQRIDTANELARAAGMEAAATEDLAAIHAWTAARLAEVYDDIAAASRDYEELLAGIREETDLLTGAMTPLEGEIAQIQRQGQAYIERANAYARAAGLEGASAEDIAAIHAWVAAQIDEASDRLEGAGEQVDQAFSGAFVTNLANVGDAFERLDDAVAALKERVRNFLDGLALDDNLSPLPIRERFAEAEARYQELFALADSGDMQALDQLQGAFRDVLALGAGMFTTATTEYQQLFDRRSDIEALVDRFEPNEESSNPYLTSGVTGGFPLQYPTSIGVANLVVDSLTIETPMTTVEADVATGTFTLIDGVPAGGQTPGPGGIFGLPGFDIGTAFVPEDMPANIHRGEMIIDPVSSDVLRRYGIRVDAGGRGGDDDAKILAEIRDELRTRGSERSTQMERALNRLEALIERQEAAMREQRQARQSSRAGARLERA